MPGPRLVPGGITATSARLRLDLPAPAEGAPPLIVRPEPPGLRIDVAPAERPTGLDARPGFRVDLTGLQPDTRYAISAVDQAGLEPNEVEIRTPPDALGPGRSVLLGMTSCYFPSDAARHNPRRIRRCLDQRVDDRIAAGARVDDPAKVRLPTVSFRMGDQVYADAPGALLGGIEDLFRERYRDAWSGEGWADAFAAGANLFTGDDHEFWNGFPDGMPWEPRTWGGGWKKAARVSTSFFRCHQGLWNFAPGIVRHPASQGWMQGRLGGVPYFVVDGRTGRSSRNGHRWPSRLDLSDGAGPTRAGTQLLVPEQLSDLLGWIEGLGPLGLLVVGQPIFQRPGAFDNALADYSPQWDQLMNTAVNKILRDGTTLVVLTGDIHWGRLYSWTPPAPAAGRLVELAASAVARVNTPLSILGRRFSPGPKADLDAWTTGGEAKHAEVLERFLPGWTRRRHFATNEHNLGLVEITAAGGSGLDVTCELWNLETVALARDGWLADGELGRCRYRFRTG